MLLFCCFKLRLAQQSLFLTFRSGLSVRPDLTFGFIRTGFLVHKDELKIASGQIEHFFEVKKHKKKPRGGTLEAFKHLNLNVKMWRVTSLLFDN